jgi:prepilin-type N-terminal cleavage/methylation domain-containing protein
MLVTRRGFTLVELLIAMVLLGIVSAGIYRVLVNNQRVYQQQTQRIDLQQNIRAAANILPAEFRELAASDTDITVMTATSLQIRAMRWLAFVCTPPVTGGALGNLTLTVRGGAPGQPMFYGARGLDLTKDSLLIYYDGRAITRNDDAWALARPVASQALNCLDGRPGLQITLNQLLLRGAPNVPGSIPLGAPVRGFERVTYQLYQPAGDTSWYIGFQPSGGTMQPLIGPVLPNGLNFAYFDSLGVATAVPTRVARIDITVRARTAQLVRQNSGAVTATRDSVVTSVALRNNRRF